MKSHNSNKQIDAIARSKIRAKQITVQHLDGLYMLAVNGIEPIVTQHMERITDRVRTVFGAPFHITVEELGDEPETLQD